MNGGLINCSCGQQQYVETMNDVVNCVKCEKQHKVYPIPEPEPKVIEVEVLPEEGE